MGIPLRTLKLHGLDDTYVLPAHNLLINSDFRNPVNTGGLAKYIGHNIYTIDKWLAWHSGGNLHVSILDGYIKLWAENYDGLITFSQRINKGILDANKRYTFAYMSTSGKITIKYDAVTFSEPSFDYVQIEFVPNQTLNLVWAALYEGEYTLDTLPEYQPKGYNIEYLNCCGCAPAGYGLGETVPDSVTDCNLAIKNGWYRTEQATLNQPMPRSCWMRVDAYSEGWTHQVWFYDQENCGELHRYQKNGVWSEWEWENPPMVPGVEYRTTERWNGNPVYTKLIDCGVIATEKTINIGVYGISTSGQKGLIRHYAFTNTGRAVISAGGVIDDWSVKVHIDIGKMHVTAGAGIAGNNEFLYLQVWYIKDY